MSDRKVTVQISKDDRPYGAVREKSLGELGQRNKRVRIKQLGDALAFRIKVRCTSPIACNFMGAVADLEQGE